MIQVLYFPPNDILQIVELSANFLPLSGLGTVRLILRHLGLSEVDSNVGLQHSEQFFCEFLRVKHKLLVLSSVHDLRHVLCNAGVDRFFRLNH